MTFATNINRFAFSHLKAPPQVLGAPNWIVPGAEMEASYFPQAADVVTAVCSLLKGEQRTGRLGHVDWNETELARLGL